jgi:uncharacterized protein (DUF1015 family)
MADQPTGGGGMTADGPGRFPRLRSLTRYHWGPVPTLRPFRALRYRSAATDLSRLICPPYDVIDPPGRERFAARDPHNAVQLELPARAPGEGDDEPYRRAARTLAEWRNAGVLGKDRAPSVYVCEQTYRLPAGGEERTQRGIFVRLKLEEPVLGAGVLRHERTLDAPKEDRYRLLRATGLNTSPVVGIFRSDGAVGREIGALADRAPDAEAVDDEDVRHRLWIVPLDEPRRGPSAAALLGSVPGPIVIADGHHRYETALRYRDERERACESDPPFDYILALLFDVATERLTILPTHRILAHGPGDESLLAGLAELFEVQSLEGPAELIARMSEPAGLDEGGAGTGRIGLLTGSQAAVLHLRPEPFAPLLERLPAVLRGVDVVRLEAAFGQLAGIDAAAARTGNRLAYTKDPGEALAAVDRGAAAAFLLDPTPVGAVFAVAVAGEVLPQKSTFFYPKAATGLLFNPHEQ